MLAGLIQMYPAPLMFAGMLIFLLLGVPVAFALGTTGLLFAWLAQLNGLLPAGIWHAYPAGVWSRVVTNETLLAIPFFTFMGLILQNSGMAERLLEAAGKLFGPIRGGLAYAVIAVGALLAATTGVVAASVMTMGLIALPVMLRSGYKPSLAAGVIASSGTLAQIIPPSLVLIILADQLGRSVGDLYSAALVPSILLVSLYTLYILVVSVVQPKAMPAVPVEFRAFASGAPYARVMRALIVPLALLVAGSTLIFAPQFLQDLCMANALPISTFFALALASLLLGYTTYFYSLKKYQPTTAAAVHEVMAALVPPLGLIFPVLGTVFNGIATPTEGGAMGAVGAVLIAALNQKLSFKLLHEGVVKTGRLTAFVMFILIGARLFSETFYLLGGHTQVEGLLANLPGGKIGFLITVNVLVFFLAFFLDFFELVFIVVPLLIGSANALGIDLVWLGVMLAVNIQTSFLHPPFGFALFYLRSVAPQQPRSDPRYGIIPAVTNGDMYRGVIPFLLLQLFVVVLLIVFPQLIKVQHVVNVNPAALQSMLPPHIELP